MNQGPSLPSQSPNESADEARRAFLEKAGKLAAYTPPVMLALMYPSLDAVASGFTCPSRTAKAETVARGPKDCIE